MSAIPSHFTPIITRLDAAQYLAAVIMQGSVKTVGIWGPSGGGKTTFSQLLANAIGADNAFVWKVENYWQYTRPEMAERGLTGYHWETRDQQRFLNDFDQIKKGHSVQAPVFDNIREVPTDQTVVISPKDIIILEDTLDFSDIVDLGIFMYAPDTILVERRIARDANQTGLGSPTELETYVKTKSLPTYKTNLAPSLPKAHYIVNTHDNILYRNNILPTSHDAL